MLFAAAIIFTTVFFSCQKEQQSSLFNSNATYQPPQLDDYSTYLKDFKNAMTKKNVLATITCMCDMEENVLVPMNTKSSI